MSSWWNCFSLKFSVRPQTPEGSFMNDRPSQLVLLPVSSRFRFTSARRGLTRAINVIHRRTEATCCCSGDFVRLKWVWCHFVPVCVQSCSLILLLMLLTAWVSLHNKKVHHHWGGFFKLWSRKGSFILRVWGFFYSDAEEKHLQTGSTPF